MTCIYIYAHIYTPVYMWRLDDDIHYLTLSNITAHNNYLIRK